MFNDYALLALASANSSLYSTTNFGQRDHFVEFGRNLTTVMPPPILNQATHEGYIRLYA
jgi:hypothetical protein